jgi:hypothetical protein
MMQIEFVKRWLLRIVAALTLSAVYLYGYPSATISYFVVDLLHVAIGMAVAILLLVFAGRLLREESLLARLGWISLALGTILGLVLLRCALLARFFWGRPGSSQKGGLVTALFGVDWDLPRWRC